jgi:methylase of polypeptide subunit release factors
LARRLLEHDGDIVTAFQAFLHSGNAESQAVLAELAEHQQTPHPEPYFLELLQAQADRAARKRHGVYFTPGPVVEWMLSRVEQLVPNGPLRIVDPACGGGVFLLAAAKLAERRPGSSLVGFDVSPAAIAVTRELLRDSKVPTELKCVNPLLAGDELQHQLLPRPSTLVILGNPPYANYGRLNRGPWIDALLADYRRGVHEQKLNLTDDFIKFLRWGQHWIDQAEHGVLAMITSRTYLTGVTHRGMRRSLIESFPRIEIADLHGDDASGDENIFPIRRGVAIGVFAKVGQASSLPGQRNYASLQGSRIEKLAALQYSCAPVLRIEITLAVRSPLAVRTADPQANEVSQRLPLLAAAK